MSAIVISTNGDISNRCAPCTIPTEINNTEITVEGIQLVNVNTAQEIPTLEATSAVQGASGDDVSINYSVDNVNWHATLTSDDRYIRFRIGSGAWSTGVQFVGSYIPGNYIDLTEITAPSNPSANTARIYCADDEGVTKVYYKDSAGNITILSTSVAGTDTQIQFNDGGVLGSSSSLIWDGSELGVGGNVDITTGSVFQINNVDILSATTLGESVVNSSLTSVGTITTGVWQGTVIDLIRGGLGNDVSAFEGILTISSGAASYITDSSSDWDLAYDHISENGSSHSFIDQNVTTLGTPTFATVTVGNLGLVVGSSIPFSDSSGTLTLQNIDAIDATTESTIEAAIDTLNNLTTVGTLTSGTVSTGFVLGPVTVTLGSDADGDIYYRSGSKLTRLAKGTALQYLRMNAGASAPEYADLEAGAQGDPGYSIIAIDGSGVISDTNFEESTGWAAREFESAIDTSTGHLWVRGETSWADLGSIQGEDGDRWKTTSLTSIDISSITEGDNVVVTCEDADLAWIAGQYVKIIDVADIDNYLVGQVTDYTSPDITFEVVYIGGTATISSWNVTLPGALTDILSSSYTANKFLIYNGTTNKIASSSYDYESFLLESGGTLSGFLTLHASPTSDYHAVTKEYVDTECIPLNDSVDWSAQWSSDNFDSDGVTKSSLGVDGWISYDDEYVYIKRNDGKWIVSSTRVKSL